MAEPLASKVVIVTGGASDEHGAVISQPLIEGLLVAYAIDNDRTIAYIPRKRFESWNMSLEDLHKLAVGGDRPAANGERAVREFHHRIKRLDGVGSYDPA